MALLQSGIVLLAASSVLVPSHPRVDTPRQLISGRQAPTYGAQSVEHYLTTEQIGYVRPGLNVTVESVTIPADRRTEVVLSFTDNMDQPLDRLGKTTPGAISPGFILAWYDAANIDYVAYTTRPQTSPITGVTAVQSSTDSGGSWTELGPGRYMYKFKTVLPASYDRTKTHTLGIYARRDLTEIIDKSYFANVEYDFRPDGMPVTEKWDATTTATCNQCHDPLAAHGETGRRDPKLCVMCHNDTQSLDPDTGNVVNFKVMIHKIHMGENLPSVQAGHPYQIIGYGQGVNDYSTVAFPQDIRNCRTCHMSPDPKGQIVSQAHIWYTEPSRMACGSCHDNINWETGEGHIAGPQMDDSACNKCHLPQGETEFDVSIMGAHTIPTKSTQLPGINLEILDVSHTAPGEKPVVTFKLTDKNGDFVNPNTMNRFRFLVGGPTTDYASSFREDVTPTTCNGDTCEYSFKGIVPVDATGTWTLSADYYENVTIDNHSDTGLSVRMAGMNPIYNFIVTDAQPMARRQIVDTARCNNCHDVLALHGGQRFKVEECVICHNANATADSVEGAPPESIHLKWMVHRIHTGEELNYDYSIGGTSFNEVRYPGDRRDCQQCHVAGSYNLPVAEGALPTITERDFFSPMKPATAACLSCHDSIDAAAHAYVNDAPFGEACASCHGPDREFSVEKVHAR